MLIDSFQNNIANSITQIKTNGNEIDSYISIDTGEDWRADYSELQSYLDLTMYTFVIRNLFVVQMSRFRSVKNDIR